MSEFPVELARVRDDSYCRVEDTLQLVGRLPHSASQETAALIDSARDEVKARSTVQSAGAGCTVRHSKGRTKPP